MAATSFRMLSTSRSIWLCSFHWRLTDLVAASHDLRAFSRTISISSRRSASISRVTNSGLRRGIGAASMTMRRRFMVGMLSRLSRRRRA